MDTKLFKTIKAALAFATFKDEDVESKLNRLLTVSDSELNEAGFEESLPIEEACEEVEEAIADADPLDTDEDEDEKDDEDNEEDNDNDDDDDDDDDDDENEDDEDD